MPQGRPRSVSPVLFLLGVISTSFLAAPGCGVDPLQSRVTEVYPGTIPSFGQTQLTFTGVFVGQWQVSTKTGTVTQRTDFSVWLQRLSDASGQGDSAGEVVSLHDVVQVDEYTLTAWTPDGLDGGTYAVVVEDPRGHPAVVDPDVQVVVNPSTPDHVVFLPDEKQWLSANSTLTLNLMAVDDKNLPYPIAGLVTVTVDSPGILVTDTSLVQVQEVTYGDGRASLSGYLSADGQATVTIACEDSATCISLPPFLVQVYSPPEWPGASTVGAVEVEVVEPYSALKVSLPDAPSNEHIPFAVKAGQPFSVVIQARGMTGTAEDEEPPVVHGEVLLFDVNGVIEYAETPPEDPQGCIASTPLVLQDGAWSGTVTCYVAVEEDKLFAVGPLQKYGESRPFDVVAGDASRLEVQTEFMEGAPAPTSRRVVAGTVFWVSVAPVDAYGNHADMVEEEVPEVWDQVGGLRCSGPYDPETHQLTDCRAEIANEGDVIRATLGGLEGESPAFDVLAGDLAGIAFDTVAPQVEAGATFSVKLWAADQFKNPVGYGAGTVVVVDEPEGEDTEPELGEGVSVRLKDGYATLELQFTRAVQSTRLAAHYDEYSGQSDSFEVVPAGPSGFLVEIPESTVVAGDVQTARLSVEDPYGNRVYDYDGTHALTLTPIDTRLEGDTDVSVVFAGGIGEVSYAPVEASDAAWLQVADAGGVVGVSAPFQVLARPDVEGFAFLELPGVLWTDVSFPLTVRAVDVYGNHVTGYEGLVRLDDWTGTLTGADGTNLLPGKQIRLESGEFRGRFTVSETSTSDKLVVSDDRSGIQSTSLVFPVYDLECADPPTTTLQVGSRGDYAVGCEQDPVDFRASGSSEYGVMDVVWTFDDGEVIHAPRLWETQHAYAAAGEYRPAVSVVDRRLCASWMEAAVFVGVHDGSPTGPMTMTLVQGDLPLVAGADDGSQVATVEIQATDCREDSASYSKSGEEGGGFEITVLPTLGNVEVGDVSDRPGIQYLLGPYSGAVQFNYSVGDTVYGGTARIVAVYEGENALGETVTLASGVLEVPVENDHARPYPVAYSPAGYFFTSTDRITVTFSEPIRGDNLVDPGVVATLDDADHPIVEVRVSSSDIKTDYVRWPISDLSLEEDGRQLVISLAQVLDLERKRYQVEVALSSGQGIPSVTDLDGNLLDGNWNGILDRDPETHLGFDPFVWHFGRLDVAGIQPVEAECWVSEPVFSPDGQNGEGDAADSTVFQGEFTLRSGIRAFSVDIFPPAQASPVVSLWSPVSGGPTQANLAIEWHGTGSDGQRLPNGVYTFQVNVIDVYDNWDIAACTGEVEIRNPIDLGAFL